LRDGKGIVSKIQRKKLPKLLRTWKEYSNHVHTGTRIREQWIHEPTSFSPRHA